MSDNLVDADLAGAPGGAGGPPPPHHPIKRDRVDDDDEDDEGGKTGRERRKIEIKFISDKSRRHITFSKRKAGIMKKAYELSVLTGTQVLLLVVSETGLVYTFTTPKLQPLVTKPEGKNLIQACLNAPEENSPPGPGQGLGDPNGDMSDEMGGPPPPPHHAAPPHSPPPQQRPPPPQQQQQQPPGPPPGVPPQGNPAYMSAEQAAVYNSYLGGMPPGNNTNQQQPSSQNQGGQSPTGQRYHVPQ